MEDIITRLEKTTTILDFAVTGAPTVQNHYRRPLTIQPDKIKIRARDGVVWTVQVKGVVQRRDGKPGTRNAVSWMWSGSSYLNDSQQIPGWLVAIVRDEADAAGIDR